MSFAQFAGSDPFSKARPGGGPLPLPLPAPGLPFLATRWGCLPKRKRPSFSCHAFGAVSPNALVGPAGLPPALRIRQLADLLDAPVCPLTELVHLLELFPTSCSAGFCGCNICWMLRSTTFRGSWIFSNCVVGCGASGGGGGGGIRGMLGLSHEAGGTIGRAMRGGWRIVRSQVSLLRLLNLCRQRLAFSSNA